MGLLLPDGAAPHAGPVLLARGLRGFVDGALSVLLPAYLLSLGLDSLQVGLIAAATLLGSALATLAVGVWGQRLRPGRLLRFAPWLMVATGLGFAGLSDFWPLLLVAFAGTLNPSSGDVSVFLPLEHQRLAEAAGGAARTHLFARYSLLGGLCAALGALAVVWPAWMQSAWGWSVTTSLRAMFLLYAAAGLLLALLYRRGDGASAAPPQLLSPASRRIVWRLSLLFSVDAFGGGLVVQSLLSLWLMTRFQLGLAEVGTFFFATGLLSAASQLAAPWVAQRIGLLNTMVFTHLPANACLVAAAFAPGWDWAMPLLLVRAALMQMDVPTRSAYVMAVVRPEERAAAASFTTVPRSLAAAVSPALAGALLSAGWLAAPLLAGGLLKIGYDLALWWACRGQKLDPED